MRFQVDSLTRLEAPRVPFDAERGDYVSVLEAAYAAQPDDVVWLSGLLEAASPILDQGHGTHAFGFRYTSDCYHIQNPVHLNAAPGAYEAMNAALSHVQLADLRRMFDSRATLLSNLNGFVDRPAVKQALGTVNIADQVCIIGRDLSPSGCAMGAIVPMGRTYPKRALRKLEFVAAHLAAAQRLRARARDQAADPRVGVEAVLGPTGKILHAESEAQGKDAREALSTAGRSMDRARGRLRRSDPREALQHWRALVAGRWSLLEEVESDGKRFLLARKNPSGIDGAAALTLIEQQVAGYAALGHPNKYIAYEVGIAPSTVTKHVKSALKKLGFRSRAELIRMLESTRE